MSAIRLYSAAAFAHGVLLDHGPVVLECRAGFRNVDGHVQTFAGGFDDTDGVRVGERFVAYVVGLVYVAVEAAVVQGYVDVYDVAVLEDALVGDAVADAFVYRGADGFGEVAVVEGGGVGL